MSDRNWRPVWVDSWLEMPEVDEEYRHYKGGLYKVVAVGRLSEARDQLMVVYASKKREEVWIRPLGMFTEQVDWADGKRRPRFVRTDYLPDAEHETIKGATVNLYKEWPDE